MAEVNGPLTLDCAAGSAPGLTKAGLGGIERLGAARQCTKGERRVLSVGA
jgi:hypothetical protein